MTVIETIDITPSWTAVTEFHIGVLDGSIKIMPKFREQAKEDARNELRRMAAFVDKVNARSRSEQE